MAPPKRKRNERGSVDAGDGRPSPHRPGVTGMGQRDREVDMRGDRRRNSRGGRGGTGGPRTRNSERKYSSDNINGAPTSAQATPGPMSPPPRPSSAMQLHTATITTLSPASVDDVSSLEAKSTHASYDYFYLTDSRVASWSLIGRQEVVAAGKQAQEDLDSLDLSTIFQELLHATLDKRLDAKDAGDCVREILEQDTAHDDNTDKVDGPALFADTLSVITDSETFDTALQSFVVASGVSPVILRQLLDQELLQNLRLTRETFTKSGIRQVTNLLYRQANHNLLREETEGYSKLITELFTTSANEPHTGEVVEETFERVKGLIGTFNLDVGRVLDITLDVFAAVLIKQFKFFVKFLRISSWWPRDSGLNGLAASENWVGGLPQWAIPNSAIWNSVPDAAKPPTGPVESPESADYRAERDRKFWDRAREIGLDAFFELGGRHPIEDETRKAILGSKSDPDVETDADRQWIEATGTLPPSGSRVAAQLLGFKLRFYSSEARDEDDVLPANLIFLSALLIKIGFVSLRDLYPHLWPLDEDMEAVRVEKMKEIAEKERLNRPGAAQNALMTAGALVDDTLPNNGRTRETAPTKSDSATTAPTDETEEKDKLPEPQDQKVQLLIHLLTIGAIPESLFMLSRFAWLPGAFPEIYDLIHRILHHSINKVYEDSQIPSISAEECPGIKYADFDQTSAPKGHVRRTQFIPRKLLRWPHADKYDQNEGTSYRFYWDEWADDIPVCQTVDDIFTLCSTLLNFSGVNIGRDSSLLSKLATIGTKSLSENSSEANLARWKDLLKRLLVPALSLSKSNISLANEIYDMLRYYPGPIRFSIYAEWFEGQTSRLPAIITAFTRTRLETLSTMKRISKTNITAMARTLAKTAYTSPGIVFKVALDQIEAYPNLTEVVVECAKYFTDLGYDVLIWSLMSALGGKSRSRTRQDAALLTSRWLIALSKFSGSVFRRYSIMNPAPILQYVNDQLSRGNSTDLIILEELIAQMSGVVSDIDFTDSQLSAMTGGEILRRQTLISLHDKRFDSTKSAKRLMRSLTETKLAGQLLISIAQHRQSAIYAVPDDEAHIKLLSQLIDETQRILTQYLDLLRSNLSVEQFDSLVPSAGELMTNFGLEPSLAFLIGRLSFAHRLAALKLLPWKDTSRDHVINNSTSSRQDGDGDKTNPPESPRVDESLEGAVLNSTGDALADGSSDGNFVSVSPYSSVESWHEVLKPLVDAVQKALPKKTWRLLNPEFYVVFWQLSLTDITLPMDSYGAESQRLQKEMTELMRDTTRPGVTRKDDVRRVLETTISDLLKESKQEVIKYEGVRARLNKEKAHWFKNVHPDYEDLCDLILEDCVLPRVMLSPSDADYSFRMIKFLHNNGTPNFRTLALYVRLFRSNRLRSLIFSCTIREAENLGRFLKLILRDLSSWHSSKTTYEKEALGTNRDLPGFAKSNISDGKPAGLLEFEEFRRVLFTFHKNLNTALKSCLSGTEYMQIRNAITVLKSVVEYFPAIDFMGKYYKGALTMIADREKDKRGDLSLTANSSLPDLKKRESKWVMPQAFASNLNEPGQQPNGSQPKSVTPQPEVNALKSGLQPTAPEFKPQSRVASNGASISKGLSSGEVEDGEVDDAKALMSVGEPTPTTQGVPISANSNIPTLPPENGPPNTPLPARAEQIPRASTPKAPASMPLQPSPAQRPDNSRSFPSSSILDKQHTGLPSRPDVPFPSHRLDRPISSRPGDRRDGHMSRGERPGDIMRDRPRDPLERRGLDNIPRDVNRPSDRGMGPDRERDRHDPIRRSGEPRDPRENRDLRDRPFIDSMRLADANGRPVRGDAIGPHRSVALQSDRTPGTLNAERLLAANTERHTHVSTNNEPPRPDPPRGGRDEHRDRPSSRPHSPRRLDSYITERDHAHGRRNDRPNMGRPSTSDMQDFPRNRHDEQWAAPAGPRDDRPGDRGGPSERGRDGSAFQPPLPPPRSLDTNHGRLNQSSRSQQDPNFGRLNSGPPPPIPSGPRDRNIRGGPGGLNRMSSLSQPRFEGRPAQESPRPPTPDRQPPTGPASNRPPRHGAPAQFDAPAPLSIPASVPASPNTIIHPDRLKQLDPTVESQGNVQSTSQQAPPLPSPIVPPLVSVHPDRFKAIHGDQGHSRPPPPLSLQTANIRTSTMNAPSPISSGPPLGPKGHHSSNNTPSTPNGMSAPTGPASNIDRTRGPRRQLAGIQNTLQQAGQQGSERFGDRVTNIRGRSTRNNGINSPGVEPPSPSGPPTPTLPPRPEAREGFMPVDRNRDLINPDRPDLFSNRGHNGSDNDRERERADNHARGRELPPSSGRRERSDRHSSRRDSREHSPAREHREDREQRGGREPRTLEDSSRSGEEYRGRRTGERDRRQGGSGEMSGRGTEREMGRRDGGDKNRAVPNLEPEWGGSQPNIIRGSGGRRDVRPSASDIGRRDSRGGGRDDASSSSRKRRTDEVGIMGDMRGHDKRLRR